MTNDDIKGIIMELEQMPDEELNVISGIEILGTKAFSYMSPPVTCPSASRSMLDKLINKIREDGLLPELVEAFKVMVDTMDTVPDIGNYSALRKIRSGQLCIDTDIFIDIDEELLAMCFGIYFMILPTRKIVIAALAAKRYSLVEAGVRGTSSPSSGSARLHTSEQKPFATAAVDIQKDNIDTETMEHDKCFNDDFPMGKTGRAKD